MRITRLEKNAMLNSNTVRLSLDIQLTSAELEMIDYGGFDLFPDELIADLLVAVGKKYQGKIKKGRIVND